MPQEDERLSASFVNLIVLILIVGVISFLIETIIAFSHAAYLQAGLYLILLVAFAALLYSFITEAKWGWYILLAAFFLFNLNLAFNLLTTHIDLYSSIIAVILLALFDLLFFLFVFWGPHSELFQRTPQPTPMNLTK